MELLTAINTRSSSARVTQPGPSPAHLACILEAAGHAPDHGRLRPWRLTVLDAQQRDQFALAAAAAKRTRVPAMSDEQFRTEREKFLLSPTIVVVGCKVRRDQTKIPEIEQIADTAAAAQNLFLAAYDLGYGVMWKTGAAAYDTVVKATVGLAADDHIVGIMHLGTREK